MEIISVANQKGGCGKTITAVNLAGALAHAGKKVLFIDLDPQAHATAAFGMKIAEVTNSTYALLESFVNTNLVISMEKLMYQKTENLWVIGSHISLSTMEQKLANVKGAILGLSTALLGEDLSKFDYVIIDTPPNLGFVTLNALHASHRILVPLDVSIFSLNGVSQIENILALSKSMGFEKPLVNFLLTIFDCRSNFATAFLETARASFGERLMKTVIRSNVKLREAAMAGKTVDAFDPYSNGSKDYQSLASELLAKTQEAGHMTTRTSAAQQLRKEMVSVKNDTVQQAELKAEDAAVNTDPVVLTAKETDVDTFFKLVAPHAKEVYIVGSFNQWSMNKDSLMKKLTDETWIKRLSLKEGNYKYKFVVDGRWVEDPANASAETDGLGGRNSLVTIRQE